MSYYLIITLKLILLTLQNSEISSYINYLQVSNKIEKSNFDILFANEKSIILVEKELVIFVEDKDKN